MLVDNCLRHRARDRPSINALLRLPVLKKRIETHLSETVATASKFVMSMSALPPSLPHSFLQLVSEEFSHTVLHHRAPPPPQGWPLVVSEWCVSPPLPSGAAPKKYQPAAVYAPKSEKKIAVVRVPPSKQPVCSFTVPSAYMYSLTHLLNVLMSFLHNRTTESHEIWWDGSTL